MNPRPPACAAHVPAAAAGRAARRTAVDGRAAHGTDAAGPAARRAAERAAYRTDATGRPTVRAVALALALLAAPGAHGAERLGVIALGDPPVGPDAELAELTHQLRAACRDRVGGVEEVAAMRARLLGQGSGATLSELDRAYGGALAVYQNGDFESSARTLRAIIEDLEGMPEGEEAYFQWTRCLLRLAHVEATLEAPREVEEALAKLARTEPTLQPDPDQYSPGFRRRFEEIKARVRALPQRRLQVLAEGRAGTIYVNGRAMGTAPATITLPAGTYRVGGAAGPLHVPSFEVDLSAEDRVVVLDFALAEALRPNAGPGLALAAGRRGYGIIRAGAWLGVDQLVVASRGAEGDAQFLLGAIYDVRRGALLREGSVRMVAGGVPSVNLGALAAFLLTGQSSREVRSRLEAPREILPPLPVATLPPLPASGAPPSALPAVPPASSARLVPPPAAPSAPAFAAPVGAAAEPLAAPSPAQAATLAAATASAPAEALPAPSPARAAPPSPTAAPTRGAARPAAPAPVGVAATTTRPADLPKTRGSSGSRAPATTPRAAPADPLASARAAPAAGPAALSATPSAATPSAPPSATPAPVAATLALSPPTTPLLHGATTEARRAATTGRSAWARPWMRPVAIGAGVLAVGLTGVAIHQGLAATSAYGDANRMVGSDGLVKAGLDPARYQALRSDGDRARRNALVSAGVAAAFAATAGALGWISWDAGPEAGVAVRF